MGIGMQLLALASLLASVQPAFGIPAFARKYGLPCSACHEAWPMLNNCCQTFEDYGYQLGNEIWRRAYAGLALFPSSHAKDEPTS
jgi:hypothetical protein